MTAVHHRTSGDPTWVAMRILDVCQGATEQTKSLPYISAPAKVLHYYKVCCHCSPKAAMVCSSPCGQQRCCNDSEHGMHVDECEEQN
eukprot:6459281-Amphidinium_carterae.1